MKGSNLKSTDASEMLVVFDNPQFGQVRTFVSESGEPMFCLADVCKALGLSARGVGQRLDKGVISNYPLYTKGGTQQALFVNEDGLYDVIFDSRKPEAKAFRKWVTKEVLPSIRKTGSYSLPKAEAPKPRPVQITPAALDFAAQMQQASLAVADALSDGRRRDFFDYLMLVQQPASFYTVATDYGFSVSTLIATLLHLSIIRVRRDKDGPGNPYELCPIHDDKGYLQAASDPERVVCVADPEWVFNADCEWSPKGRAFLYAQLKRAGILPVLERNLLMLSQPKR